MYGPGAAPPMGGRGPIPAAPLRQMTPRGQMSGGANQRPPLADLAPGMKLMFEPRPPLEFKPAPALLMKKPPTPYSGIAQFTSLFETEPPPPVKPIETPAERKERRRQQLIQLQKEKNDLIISSGGYEPSTNPKATE